MVKSKRCSLENLDVVGNYYILIMQCELTVEYVCVWYRRGKKRFWKCHLRLRFSPRVQYGSFLGGGGSTPFLVCLFF